MKYNITVTEDEIKSLMSFIDVGVRNSGLQAAESAVHFKRKFEAAMTVEPPEEIEDDD